jgi:hypothetical protein
MYYSPHSHLAIARARHEDMLLQAERARLARSFDEERPGVLSRLRMHVPHRREQPRPVAV